MVTLAALGHGSDDSSLSWFVRGWFIVAFSPPYWRNHPRSHLGGVVRFMETKI